MLSRFNYPLLEEKVSLLVLMASCVSHVSVFAFRYRMNLQGLEGLVLHVMVLKSYFHAACSSCRIE